MKIETTRKVLMPSQIQPGIQLNGAKSSGDAQPPRNISEARAEIRIMFAYSARKNMANDMPEYSTMCPATISDSPSTTSNGWRLVSAMPEITYTKNMGSSGSQFQDRKVNPWSAKKPLVCDDTISVKFRLPDTISTM